ncbi:TonB-dependent receptor [Weeksellaceae bacterium TAE3-ERU29]|nr:TonB-dependent receptor [Weeksellaceae bacterium TAE3-ERU29]
MEKAKDTANVSLDRFGNIRKHGIIRTIDDIGELYGMDLSLDYTLKTFRGNLSYGVLPNQNLEVNHTYTAYDRIGTDPIGGRAISKHPDNYNEIVDIYTYPSIFQKSVSAVGWEGHFLDKKLESILAYKHYRIRMAGYTTINKIGNDSKIYTNSSKHDGWVAGLSYRPNVNWTFKTSFEHTLRMPDEFELFGDSQGIRTNFDIRPERSKNFNIEAQYRSTKTGTGAFMIGTNFFYRKIRDLIYLHPDILFSYYQNAPMGIGIYARGLDLDVYYQPFKFLTIGGNAMYMDRRLIKEDGDRGVRIQ